MDFIYFLVTSNKAWENYSKFHENFFNEENGFLMGFIGALVIALIFAAIFYFGFCNSKNTNKYATHWLWAIFLALGGVTAFFYSDLVVIGDAENAKKGRERVGLFYDYSFYRANNDYMSNEVDHVNKVSYENAKNAIESDLDKGKGVRFDYNITTTVLALVWFFLISLIIKRFTIGGKCIPLAKP